MIKQHLHRFFYLCYLVLLFLGLVFFHHYFFFLALFLSIFLPLCSLLLTAYIRQNLVCQFQFPPHSVSRESTMTVTITLAGISIPVPYVEVLFSICAPYADEPDSYIMEASIPGRKESTLSISYPVEHSGYLKLNFHGIRIHGYFNLITLYQKQEQTYPVMILPKQLSVPAIQPAFGGTGTETYADSTKKGNDASEPNDIREYQPGDRLQKIHWKMSVKQDTLLVKEYSGTTGKEIILYLELSPMPDHVFDLLYSYGCYLVDQSWHFYVKWHSVSQGSLITNYVESEQDLLETLSLLYYEPCHEKTDTNQSFADLDNLGGSMVLYLKSGEEYGTWISI